MSESLDKLAALDAKIAEKYAGTVGSVSTSIDKPAHEFLLQFFAFEHLPPNLQMISEPFAGLAECICEGLPRNPERTVALRKLLEAKDCAVRAMVAK